MCCLVKSRSLTSFNRTPTGLQPLATAAYETTDAALKGQTISSSYKPAVLNNGFNIQVPPFIEAEDEIVVDTRNLEYVKKI